MFIVRYLVMMVASVVEKIFQSEFRTVARDQPRITVRVSSYSAGQQKRRPASSEPLYLSGWSE
jgi:hypothetical protein